MLHTTNKQNYRRIYTFKRGTGTTGKICLSTGLETKFGEIIHKSILSQVQSEREREWMFAFTCHMQPFPNFQTIMNKAEAQKQRAPNKASHGELTTALAAIYIQMHWQAFA